MFIDLKDHNIRLLQDPAGDPCGTGEIKESVPVHGSHSHHGDIHCQEMPVIGDQIAEDHRNIIAKPPVAQFSFIGRTMPAVITEMLPFGIGLHRSDGAKAQISPDLDIKELVPALCEGFIQQSRETDIGPVVHPVPALYQFDRFLRRPEFLPVFVVVVHGFPLAECNNCPVLSLYRRICCFSRTQGKTGRGQITRR